MDISPLQHIVRRFVPIFHMIVDGIALLTLFFMAIAGLKSAAGPMIILFEASVLALVISFVVHSMLEFSCTPNSFERFVIFFLDMAVLFLIIIFRVEPKIVAAIVILRQSMIRLYQFVLPAKYETLLRRLSPFQILSMGYITIILVGSLLLMLPISTVAKTGQSFIDALFTATSAVTTTGLIVVDTGSFYSMFGQIVMLCLVQIGGLGYMIFVFFVILGFGGERLSFKSRMFLNESISHPTWVEIAEFGQKIIKYTLFFEVGGAILLALYWVKDFPLTMALYYGIFHAVSAFCTAGFSTFVDSFISYQSSLYLNSVIMILSIAGGIGFIVLHEVHCFFKKKQEDDLAIRKISTHTKLVSVVTLLLVCLSIPVIFYAETADSFHHLGKQLLTATFQAVSAISTTGFNSVDIGVMKPLSLFVIMGLMFIGASPGGTGGGVKTTSVGIMFAILRSVVMGNRDVNIFRRRIPLFTIYKAITVISLSLLWMGIIFMILSVTEKASFVQILFEIASALGTVGLSAGITATLTTTGKILIIITMLIGRVGPLVVGYSLIGKPKTAKFKYAEADILVS